MPNPRAYVAELASRATHSPRPAVRRSYRFVRQTARDVLSSVTRRQFGLVAQIQTARWADAATYEIEGWVYERGYGHGVWPGLKIWLQSGSTRIEGEVEHRRDTDVNAGARKAEFDYSNTAFRARFDLSGLFELPPDGAARHWQARFHLTGPERDRAGFFKSLNRFGSARHLFAHTAGDVQVIPSWQAGRGLQFRTAHPLVRMARVDIDGRRVELEVVSGGPELTGAGLQTDEAVTNLEIAPVVGGADLRYRISGEVPADYVIDLDGPSNAGASAYRLLLVHDAAGTVYPVADALDDRDPVPAAGMTLLPAANSDGAFTLVDAPARVMVTDFAVQPGRPSRVTVSGQVIGHFQSLTFDFWGPRQVIPVEADVAEDGTFEVTATLTVSEWGGPALPPRTGSYALSVLTENGTSLPVTCMPSVLVRMPELHSTREYRLRMQGGAQRRLRMRITAPRRNKELGSYHQARLERRWSEPQVQPQDSVYFESFYGRNATCNPRAIDAEIARVRPDLTRYWGVVDLSVPVPEGAVPVVRGTKAFWKARATSRYVVANDWLRRTFHPHDFQVVLQTWHGSMLKRLALDRPKPPRRKLREIHTERVKWDYLLSQNHHSTEIFGSAYAWPGPFWEEGYPRNDPMSLVDGAEIRERLGIRADQTVILYAPTWRENQTEMVAFLDVERLIGALGPDYVILLRGHSRTVDFGASVAVPGVIDVTTYPEVTDLFLAADALITDYSSVMFDYSITGRPMIFFVPDMDDYRDSSRGVYFDLSESAPGPVLATQDEVVQAVRELDQAGSTYADRYRAWQDRFNRHDDGHAAERVVARLLAAQPTRPPHESGG